MSEPLDFSRALYHPKEHFAELYAYPMVANRLLKMAVLALSVGCIALASLSAATYRMVLNTKPVVVRINEVGRAEAINYGSLDYRPQDREIRYFLIDFVQRHYSRVRATLQENYARSLYFLDGRNADTVMETNKKSKEIETFLTNGSDEIRVVVKNVTIEDLRTSPYKATVDFERQYISPSDPGNPRREKYVAHFVFVLRDRVPNDMIPVNPLGLTITYFREDQAFQ